MAAARVVVYGLSTEGYAVASQMAIGGADVHIIDESTPSAIPLTAEIAKTYPDVSSLQEDEPLLSMEPIDEAISRAQYLFFAPRVRKTGQDTKTEVHSKFKDAVSGLKKGSSVVFALGVGFGGNNENISVLEHVTGLEVGRQVSYFYYPLGGPGGNPAAVGAFNPAGDPGLSGLLGLEGGARFVALSSAEHFHAIRTLKRFSGLCSVLEVCRYTQDVAVKGDLAPDGPHGMFLDEMVAGLSDLRALNSSFDGANNLTYLINGSIKGIDGYIKRLIDEIRSTLKRNDLKAARTKVAISWTLDQYSMRGDRMEMMQSLASKLRDYIGYVEAYEDPSSDMFHTDRRTIVLACSAADYERIAKSGPDQDLIVVKANPLCETAE